MLTRSQVVTATRLIDSTVNKRVAELLTTQSEDIYRLIIAPMETEVVRRVVEYCQGNHVRASRLLGISRVTLRRKLRATVPPMATQIPNRVPEFRVVPDFNECPEPHED